MNAKVELLEELKDLGKEIKCARIETREGSIRYDLPTNYTEMQKEEFLRRIDFEYDDGYGEQIIFGYVWLTDGTWLERDEYDGKEWWAHKECPTIPEF